METDELVLKDKKIVIMETAERLFATNGYDATSIRDIASAGSFNSAMISYYFGSKEQLMEEILNYRTTVLEDVITTLLLRLKDPREKLLAITHFYIQKVFQQQYFYLLLIQIQALPDKHTLIRSFYNNLRYKNFKLLNNIIREGEDIGLFKKDIDTALLLFTISGTMNNLLINQDYYRVVNNLEDKSEEHFITYIKSKVEAQLTGIIEGLVLLKPQS